MAAFHAGYPAWKRQRRCEDESWRSCRWMSVYFLLSFRKCVKFYKIPISL